jgi:hypothetical protein
MRHPLWRPRQCVCQERQKDLAFASYEKSLTVEPDNPSAKAELEKLKNPPKEKPWRHIPEVGVLFKTGGWISYAEISYT